MKIREPCRGCWCSVFKLPYKVLYQCISLGTRNLSLGFNEGRSTLMDLEVQRHKMDCLYDRHWPCPHLQPNGNTEEDLRLCLLSSSHWQQQAISPPPAGNELHHDQRAVLLQPATQIHDTGRQWETGGFHVDPTRLECKTCIWFWGHNALFGFQNIGGETTSRGYNANEQVSQSCPKSEGKAHLSTSRSLYFKVFFLLLLLISSG